MSRRPGHVEFQPVAAARHRHLALGLVHRRRRQTFDERVLLNISRLGAIENLVGCFLRVGDAFGATGQKCARDNTFGIVDDLDAGNIGQPSIGRAILEELVADDQGLCDVQHAQ
jgi:hypothetical protein